MKPFNQRKYLLYINFSLKTNVESRSKVLYEFRKNFGNDSSVYFSNKNVKWKDYLLQLGDTKFVISPPGIFHYIYRIHLTFLGNGIDCHRTWEALIMGAIPIV